MNLRAIGSFMYAERGRLFSQILEHAGLTFSSVLLASLIAVPLGIFISRYAKWAGLLLGFSGILQTIPSLALLGILIPVMGIGYEPALFALFLYALMPIIRNTYTGITGIDKNILEAARAMGMNSSQRLIKIELPLALPVILAGIRTATVINVGVATLAAYIGAGGLGEFIFGGISLNNPVMMLAGAIPAAILAVALDSLFYLLQHMSVTRLRAWVRWSPALLLIPLFLLIRKPPDNNQEATLVAGLTPEFIGRSDGYPGLVKVYSLKLNHVIISDALMYKALYDKKLDIISGYSTDGRLKSYHLKILTDDRHVFPPYYAAPLVRMNVLASHPEIREVLNMLAGKISDSAMTGMNYQVDILKMSPARVAENFLRAQGIYRAPLPATGADIVIGAKIFGEQQILVNMYSMLIRGYTHLNTRLKINLGGTEIVFGALSQGSVDMYPEYTGTGLLVILKPAGPTSASLFDDKDKLFRYVQSEFRSRYKLEWLKPHGFDNSYALMMREEQARMLQISTITELKKLVDH